MKTGMTPRPRARGSDQGSVSPYLLKYLRAELCGNSSVREPGFTKKVYILAAIDPGPHVEALKALATSSTPVEQFSAQPMASPNAVVSGLLVNRPESMPTGDHLLRGDSRYKLVVTSLSPSRDELCEY